jgi:membrane protease YdiL (CAAX protease family)
LDPLAICFLFILGVFVPYISFKSGPRIRAGALIPPRRRVFKNILVMQILFLLISLFTARNRGIELSLPGTLSIGAVVFAIGMLGIGPGVIPLLWRRSSEDEKRRALLTRPVDAKDLGWWFLVSLAAGTVEEITCRGAMLALLLAMTRNWWTAVAICVVFFALGHANQGLFRMSFAGAMAVGCHVLVFWYG